MYSIPMTVTITPRAYEYIDKFISMFIYLFTCVQSESEVEKIFTESKHFVKGYSFI